MDMFIRHACAKFSAPATLFGPIADETFKKLPEDAATSAHRDRKDKVNLSAKIATNSTP